IGRTFSESLQKALRGLEVGATGFDPKLDLTAEDAREILVRELKDPGADRIWYIGDAFRAGMSLQEIYEYSGVDPWFLAQIEDLIREEAALQTLAQADLTRETLWRLKRKGFSDARLA